MNKETKVKLEKIDSLLTQVDSLNLELNKVKIDSLKEVYSIVRSNILFFKTKNINFPENKNLMKDYGSYGLVGKNLKRLLGSYNLMKENVEYSQKQLKNLRHDIKNKILVNSDSINKYINDEAKAITDIKAELSPKVQLLNKQLPFYNKIHKSVEDFKKSLTN